MTITALGGTIQANATSGSDDNEPQGDISGSEYYYWRWIYDTGFGPTVFPDSRTETGYVSMTTDKGFGIGLGLLPSGTPITVGGDKSWDFWGDSMKVVIAGFSAGNPEKVWVEGEAVQYTPGPAVTYFDTIASGGYFSTTLRSYAYYYLVFYSCEGSWNFWYESGGGTSGGIGVGIGECPYLGTWNGTGYQNSNTLLIGSEATKNVSVTDYMKVENSVSPLDGKYSFNISEFERERTKLDSVKLMTADHPEGVNTAITANNEIITYSDTAPPISCIDANGNNVTPQMLFPDSCAIEGYKDDYVIANFGTIAESHIKLLLRTDVKPGGINFMSFPENKRDSGLVVAIKDNNGSWTNISKFVPREKWYTDAFILEPYLENASQPIEIAVGWLDYHKLDWMAIDTTEDVPVETHIYSPVKADFNGEDILNTLLYTDNNNVTLVPKQNMTVEFPYEEPENGMVRDLVFISTGRYDTIPRTENIGFDVYQYVQMSVKIEGKPGNTVNINILEDGKKIGNFSITREHGNSADNIKNFSFRKHVGREYELELVNEGKKGSNPVEITLISGFSGRNETIKEKVKAGSSETIDIKSALEEILTGEKAFFFELAPPYYEIPFNWISEISWDFREDNLSGAIKISHLYSEPGDYDVTMTISYTDGLLVSLTKTLEVS